MCLGCVNAHRRCATLFPFGGYLRDGFAIAVGIVSICVCVITLILRAKKPEVLSKQLCTLPMLGNMTVETLITLFLFIWWLIGACILTFTYVLFKEATNGYFACWVALISSASACSASVPLVADATKKVSSLSIDETPLKVVFTCAIVVISAPSCYQSKRDPPGKPCVSIRARTLTTRPPSRPQSPHSRTTLPRMGEVY